MAEDDENERARRLRNIALDLVVRSIGSAVLSTEEIVLRAKAFADFVESGSLPTAAE